MNHLSEAVREVIALAVAYRPGAINEAERVVDTYLGAFEDTEAAPPPSNACEPSLPFAHIGHSTGAACWSRSSDILANVIARRLASSSDVRSLPFGQRPRPFGPVRA